MWLVGGTRAHDNSLTNFLSRMGMGMNLESDNDSFDDIVKNLGFSTGEKDFIYTEGEQGEHTNDTQADDIVVMGGDGDEVIDVDHGLGHGHHYHYETSHGGHHQEIYTDDDTESSSEYSSGYSDEDGDSEDDVISVHNDLYDSRRNGQIPNRHRHHSRHTPLGETIMSDTDINSEYGDNRHGSTSFGKGGRFGLGRSFHIDTKDMDGLMDEVKAMQGVQDSGHGHRSHRRHHKSRNKFKTTPDGTNQYRSGRHLKKNDIMNESPHHFAHGYDELHHTNRDFGLD